MARRDPAAFDFLLPGLGHLLHRRTRRGLVWLAPAALVAVTLATVLAADGPIGLLRLLVAPGVLPALALLNLGIATWRLAAGLDAARLGERSRRAGRLAGGLAVALVVIPHAIVGGYIASANAFLDATFAQVEPGDLTFAPPVETDPPDVTDPPFATPSPSPTATPVPPDPSATLRPPRTAGVGTLPALNVAVPWTRPGEVPWGTDGRFDLLLLGSDAGSDRWSRRMDVMLLVEIDVASGKVAMIGIPRNLVNAPFPPGPARDAVACGCFTELLNALYVEAVFQHPSRWPGSGAVSGIGAVRSVVAELTGRPVDAVLVADLWGVIKVVDAMGGIVVDVPAAVYDANYPDPVYGSVVLRIPAGRQRLDGRMALAYARTRHQDSDYGRMARQQTLLLAIRNQLDASQILNAPALFKAATGFSWTDLPRSALPNLVDLFGRARTASVRQLRIVPPSYPSYLSPTAIRRIQLDIAALLGTVPPPTPAPTAPPSGSPDPSASASPDPSASASPDPSGAPTPSPTPTPAPSAVPSPAPSASAALAPAPR